MSEATVNIGYKLSLYEKIKKIMGTRLFIRGYNLIAERTSTQELAFIQQNIDILNCLPDLIQLVLERTGDQVHLLPGEHLERILLLFHHTSDLGVINIGLLGCLTVGQFYLVSELILDRSQVQFFRN